jgi:two-component sensor histidine kinase
MRLDEADQALIERVRAELPMVADVSRSDLSFCCPGDGGITLIARVSPNSISSLYAADQVGMLADPTARSLISKVLAGDRSGVTQHDLPDSTPIVREAFPIVGNHGAIIAALGMETNLIAHERHRRRHRSFRRAVRFMQGMAVRGELRGAEKLSRFGEWDGIVHVDGQRRITYLSGIANNLYRRLGYQVDLRGTLLGDLSTGDERLARSAMESGECAEEERQEGSRLWNRKVIPLRPRSPVGARSWSLPWETPANEPTGALLMVHDLTDERMRENELRLKATMVQEVHHRVKNNLQAVASLLRMQARRLKDPEASKALYESVGRILSVSVIHEFLSQSEGQLINIRDVCQRIAAQIEGMASGLGKSIRFEVRGPSIYIPSRQATACALAVNELLENAVRHGYGNREAGAVLVQLYDGGDVVNIAVHDEDARLPQDFDLDSDSGLGLQIVRALVEEDLRGSFRLRAVAGVSAAIEFPKAASL